MAGLVCWEKRKVKTLYEEWLLSITAHEYARTRRSWLTSGTLNLASRVD